MNRIICSSCGRDINAIGQDNMSHNSNPICEDCYNGNVFGFDNDFWEDEEPYLIEDLLKENN